MSKRFTPVLYILCALLLVLGLSACDDGIRVSDDDAVPIKTYRQLRSTLEDKDHSPTVLIDPRPSKRYDKAHVDGAINIPINEMLAADARMANAKTIVVIAGGWNDLLGIASCKRLMALGYNNVQYFPGGMEQWKAEGGPVIETAATQPDTQPAK
jgi:rhodanese-related sulfurtransferase